MKNKSLKQYCQENGRMNIVDSWDLSKNGDLTPNDVSYNSHKDIYWKCKNKSWMPAHSFLMTVKNRVNTNSECPVCNARQLITGVNDLQTFCELNPEYSYLLMELNEMQYNPENHKMQKINPSKIIYSSNKRKYEWTCSNPICGKRFKAPTFGRIKGTANCECEKGTQIKRIKENGSLFDNRKDLMSEWDYEENNKRGLDPQKLTVSACLKADWICKICGNKWPAKISSRSKTNGTGCPNCKKYKNSSYNEKCIAFYVQKYFNNVQEPGKPDWLKPMELDVYIPDLNVGIEYDGERYHKNMQEKDIRKNLYCEKNGVKLIRVREPKCPELKIDNIYQLKSFKVEELEEVITEILKGLGITNPDVDIKRDNIKILEKIEGCSHVKSLGANFPDLAQELYFKDGTKVDPLSIPQYSNHVYDWKCPKCNGIYDMMVSQRTYQEQNCPYCANQKLLKGYNDFETYCKNNGLEYLLDEWDDDKSPSDYFRNSREEINWKCSKCGHKWKTKLTNRSNGRDCPKCKLNKQLLSLHKNLVVKKGSLLSHKPPFLKEWNTQENNKKGLYPCLLTLHSGLKASWKCDTCGHAWEARIADRTDGTGCPKCKYLKWHQI